MGIAIKLTSDIQVLDSERDTEDRILILKTMTGNELLALVAFKNNDNHLNRIERFLKQIDATQGIIIGGD